MAGMVSESFLELYDIMSNVLTGNKLNNFMESVINMSNDDFISKVTDKTIKEIKIIKKRK